MIFKEKQAAQMLSGLTLDGGWVVGEKIETQLHQSGGVYSCCYEVHNGERKGFLKAFDYCAAEKVSKNYVEELKNILDAFTLEKDILKKCLENGCRNVIQILDDGSLEVPGAEKYPRVEYLILEYAERGDIRDVLHDQQVTLEWKMRSLHQMAKGLNELHKLSIAHQDVKPSNVVTVQSGRTKLTDFGSAVSISTNQEELPPHLKKPISGSWEYAPPELLYGDVDQDPMTRRIGCDLYLLGSMIAFYFTDMSMSSLIRANLNDSLSWTTGSNYGNYRNVKSYVIQAFEKALDDIGKRINSDYLREQVILILRFLCNPDPLRRGHVKSINQLGSNYSLERFVTMFDLLARKIKLNQI
jgi:serine/threonine protein kinase